MKRKTTILKITTIAPAIALLTFLAPAFAVPLEATDPAAPAAVTENAPAKTTEWRQWGRTPERNMVGFADNLPETFEPGEIQDDESVDLSTTENVLWVTKLGSQTYGNPTIADGRIYIGTNNQGRNDPRFPGDYGVVTCIDAATGKKHWELTIPKLGSGKVGDWEFLGVCSSPAVFGDRVYVITNRCEVIALDVNGMADGNQGLQDEGQYMSYKGITPQPPVDVKPTDADIIWRYDMRLELGIYPHNITSSSVLVVGDYIYASTSNGVTYNHKGIPSPKAPSMVVLDRKAAEKEGATADDILVGEEASGLSKKILHCNWTSPTYGEVDGKPILIFGGPDGVTYAFDPKPVPDEEGFGVLTQLWSLDCNPKEYRFRDGDPEKPIKYATAPGPSEIISTPVFHDGRVYVAIGQDPEHGEGVGCFTCIDAKTGKKLWEYRINRTISTPSIADGLAYIADYSGFLYCLDAEDGTLYWKYDTVAPIWGSTLVADGKVYLGNEDGLLTVMHTAATRKLADELGAPVEIEYRRGKLTAIGSKEEREISGEAVHEYFNEVDFGHAVYLSPIVANDTLYVGTMTHLFATREGAEPVGMQKKSGGAGSTGSESAGER